MVRHNIKQAIRSMRKNKNFAFLNITGFAVAFAVTITLMLFAHKEYTVNDFIPNSKEVYRLVDIEHNSAKIDNAIVPLLKEQFPEIKDIAPMYYFNMDGSFSMKSVETKNNMKIKDIMSTNNDFFKLMGLKTVVAKTNKMFADKTSIVIPKSTAMKLFNSTDVIDEMVELFGMQFTVSAVIENIPTHATFNSDIIFNDENTDLGLGSSNDKAGSFYPRDIYFTINQGADIEAFMAKINQNFPENRSNATTVEAQSVRDIYFSKPLEWSYDKTGNKQLTWTFITIAILTLIMAIFNYANFTISRQMSTLKNSGIRITNGAQRSQIRNYYITDVALSVSIAFVLALLITWLMMPLASKLLATELNPIWLLKTEFIGLLSVLLIVVIALSSILPVAFIGRLNLQALFGKSRLKSIKHPLKRVMTITQLSISMALLVGLLVVNKQLNYVKSADLGFEKEHLLRINLPYPFNSKEALQTAMKQQPIVQEMSYTAHAPGSGWSNSSVKLDNGEYLKVRTMRVGDNFLKTFGIKLIEGRAFLESDEGKSCYISETGFKKSGWNTYEGKSLNGANIIGVVNDININSLHTSVIPVGYQYSNEFFTSLNIKLQKGNIGNQIETLRQAWQSVMKDEPFSFQFYDDYFNSLYQKEDRQAKALTLFSFIAFIITCLGLLGQIMQTTQNRIKEIGIRKINGATIKEVMLLLNKDFVWTVVVAFIIATPLAYYAMSKWLESFAYKTTLSWWVFALSGISALLIALLTVSWQSYRAASRNPVEALRYE